MRIMCLMRNMCEHLHYLRIVLVHGVKRWQSELDSNSRIWMTLAGNPFIPKMISCVVWSAQFVLSYVILLSNSQSSSVPLNSFPSQLSSPVP